MYQKSQLEATTAQPPTNKGVRDSLEELANLADSVNHHVSNIREHCFGSFGKEPNAANSIPDRVTLLDLCHRIELSLRNTDDILEFLNARL